MWWIPVLAVGLVAVLEFVRATKKVDEIDREAAGLSSAYRVQQLAARVALAPVVVRASRSAALTNRIVLDVGGEEIDARCYHNPAWPIAVVTKILYRPSVGWIIGTDGPNGPADLTAWLLDVYPARHI
jgi:hypothetical protein